MLYTSLKPYNWPQDSLDVPPGFGGMPPIEHDNKAFIGSEYFCMSAQFALTAALPAYTTLNAILTTPQDGDLWVDQIGVVSWREGPADTVRMAQSFQAAMVTIRDQRSNQSMIHNPAFRTFNGGQILFPPDAVPINLFRKLPQSGTENGVAYDGSTPPPSGFRATGTLPQPRCFTRQGGIAISLTTLFAVAASTRFDVTLAFSGWKEYLYASR